MKIIQTINNIMKKIIFLFIAVLCSTILLAQPANDNACDAIVLTLDDDCSAALPYTNVAATVEIGESAGTCYGEGTIEQTVWFSFVAPATGAVAIETDFSGSGMQDNQITVFEYDAAQTFDCAILSNYLEVACNEDKLPAPVNTDFNAALPPISVSSGTTYYIQVDGYNDGTAISEGSFCIVVSTIDPPSNDDCGSAAGYGGFGPNCTKIWGDNMPNPESATTIGATAGNANLAESCDGTGINASVYYSFLSGVEEVEFNLLEGENINVTLFSDTESCDDADDGGVELTPNCFININASDNADPMDADVLFTGLTIGTTYLMAIWTNEGEETDFQFCLTRAPAYECGDNVCYDLAENYSNCESDCPCISNIDLVSLTTGAASTAPTGVCAEIIGGTSDPTNPGIYVPFNINTLDSDLTGSQVSSSQGAIFTSGSNLNFFGYATNPLIPLPNNEYDGNLNYLFLTQSEIDAGGTITISFTSDNNACSASIEFNLADLTGASSDDCGNCNLVVSPDYSSLQCPDFNINLSIEGGIGDLWLSQNNTTIFDPGDIPIPYVGGYPESDFTLTIYDSGQPNCAFPLTLTFGDFFCPETSGDPIGTFCRLEPTVDENSSAICDDATGNILVPINFGNNVTGVLTSSPDIISGSGSQGPYYASIDVNNCTATDVTVMDESDIDAFSGTPIFNINSPGSIAGGNANVGTSGTTWGVDITTLGVCPSSVTGTIALVNDGSGAPTEFCTPDGGTPDPSQCTGIAGNIAMIDRGNCTFVNKASNAEQCGAIAVIICNNDAANPDDVIPMGGATVPAITIPAIMLSYNDCLLIKAELAGGVETCIGAPETISGCERTFTVDVCADYLVTTCDDGDCSTENDVATVGPDGAEVCACAGTPIVCPDGQSFDTTTCQCETGVIAGCTDPCDPNFDATATESDPAACAGYDTTCDDSDCNTADSYDSTTCACVNTPIDPLDCDDMDCNTDDSYDTTTCTCVNTPIDPPNCDDMDCSTDDSYDGTTCSCINTAITCPDGQFFNNTTCVCETSTVTGCTDPCSNNYNPNAEEDDGSCNAYDDTCNADCTAGPFGGTWDAVTCACINETTPVNGCTDATACNYDAAANCDNGSCTLPSTWYADTDSDGFGDPNNSTESCEQPAGYVANNNDDDDTIPNEADIPTLSQWGLILLSLILLSISTVTATQRKYSLVNSKGISSSINAIPYFDKHLFKRMLIKSIPFMLMIFVLISFMESENVILISI